MKSEVFRTLQAMRFVAAFSVVVIHSMFYARERLNIDVPLYDYGVHGVRLFFVVSGFVMIFSSRKLREKPNGWLDFSYGRVVRIVPMYWFATSVKLLFLLVSPSIVYHAKVDWLFILKSYLFIPALNLDGEVKPLLGVGWTLQFEVLFYLLFALALVLRLRPSVSVGIVLLGLSIGSGFKDADWPAITSYLDPIVLDFLFGMIAAELIIAEIQVPKIPAIILVAWTLTLLFAPLDSTKPIYSGVYSFSGVLCFVAVYSAASIEKYFGRRIPETFTYLGGTSYSLYLLHPLSAPIVPVLLAKAGIFVPWISVSGSVAIALIAGCAGYEFIEKPLTSALKPLLRVWAEKRAANAEL